MSSQHVVVFGPTGRVGAAAVEKALAAGHTVTAVARTPAKMTLTHRALDVVAGDTLDPDAVTHILTATPRVDAVINAVGVDPFARSTVVTQTARHLVAAMTSVGIERYLGITGTAQLPATAFGKITQAVVGRVIKAAADHQGAYDAVLASRLDYVLAACPYIKDGAHPGRWSLHPGPFPGGFKTVAPADVATFLVSELTTPKHHREAIGIW